VAWLRSGRTRCRGCAHVLLSAAALPRCGDAGKAQRRAAAQRQLDQIDQE
jgi:hypothetical protein